MRPPDIPSIAANLNEWWTCIEKGELVFIPTMGLIREYVPAYIPGHMNVTAGYTSSGKSQFLSQVAAYTAGEIKKSVYYFSLEDTRAEKLMSIVAVLTGVHKKKQLLNEMTYDERDFVNLTLEVISKWDLKIFDDVRTIGKVCDIIKTDKADLNIVDYIQKMKDGSKSIYENMALNAAIFFDTAQDTNTALEIASQISASAAKEADAPTIELKGAGEIAEMAHSVKRLRKGRREGQWNLIDIDIMKNKGFGKCGTINAQFDDTWTKIIPMDNSLENAHQMHDTKLANRRNKENG